MATTPAEYLRNPVIVGAPSIKHQPTSGKAYQFAGRVTISSGSAAKTVSTALVGANDIIILTSQRHTTINSGQSGAVVVRSISAGHFFTIGYADGDGPRGDNIVMFVVFKGD